MKPGAAVSSPTRGDATGGSLPLASDGLAEGGRSYFLRGTSATGRAPWVETTPRLSYGTSLGTLMAVTKTGRSLMRPARLA